MPMDIVTLIREIQDAHRLLDDQDDLLDPTDSPAMGEGCAERDVAALEDRLGARLPPSHRSFLLKVNGCARLGLSLGGLLSADRVDWFRAENGDWISAYLDNPLDDVSQEAHRVYGPDQDPARFRRAYLPDCLQIGDVFDGSVYLLNPKVRDVRGEWEAWNLANSYPGVVRWPSFQAMVEHEWAEIRRASRAGSLAIDADRILSEAIAALRREIAKDHVSPAVAVARYIRLKMGVDEDFTAWIQRTNGAKTLLDALKADGG